MSVVRSLSGKSGHSADSRQQMGHLRHRAQDDQERMRAKLLAIKIELRRIMHDPIAKTGARVKQMPKGI
jgi:hypothetical protein